ncbi:hypothetical protein [Kitasatospora sp. NPDC058190]|uniref:hypothetical protein n=1 Tax=Kitasatospora sp. NPDC058190 TaxID=3346371 RepID=UPI0036D8B4E0
MTLAHPPVDELGTLLEADVLLARSARGAVLLTGLRVYSTGLRVGLAFLRRDVEAEDWSQTATGATDGGPRIGLAHGSEAAVMTAPIEPQLATPPLWTPVHAGGGDRRYDVELWTAPLPERELHVHCRWPDHDIQQTSNRFACPRVTRRGVWDEN